MTNLSSNNNVTGKNKENCQHHNGDLNGKINHAGLREHDFQPRNSLLTDFIETSHCVRHLFIALLITLVMNNIVSYSFGSNNTILCFQCIAIAFERIHQAIIVWLFMFGFMLLVQPAFSLWAKIRNDIDLKLVKVWDRIWLMVFLSFYALLIFLPALKLKGSTMAIGTSGIVVGEQVRLLMKLHAFVRSNVPKVLSYKPHTEKETPIPSFSKYFYFLFAPTLIYMDSYPRTSKIRWRFVLSNFLDFIGCLLYMSLIVTHYFIPKYNSFLHEPQTWTETLTYMFSIMPVSACFVFISVHSVLHSWNNAWAEMLRFADRLFYFDWWNAYTYSMYFRRWNNLIHRFIHTYIYKDVYEIVAPGNKFAAVFVAFTVSSFFHEYIISLALGIFYPVLTIEFLGFGFLFFYIKSNRASIGNVLLWMSLIIGNGIGITFYVTEYSAKALCAKRDNTILDTIIPRSWSPCINVI